MLIVGDTERGHDETFLALLQRVQNSYIQFNVSKLQFKRREVVYCGTRGSADDIQAGSIKVDFMLYIPDPENEKDIRHLFGLISYLSPFIQNKTQVMKERIAWTCNIGVETMRDSRECPVDHLVR